MTSVATAAWDRAARALRSGVAAAARPLGAFALPQRCPGCGAPASAARLLCDPCRAAIPRLAFALCARCLALGREPVGCRLHGGCEVRPAWIYDERAAAVVRALKFAERPVLAASLAEELARVAPRERVDAVIAVPLHPARRRERGYDQAGRLAVALAARLGAPPLAGVLERARATRPQARLGPRARRRNLSGAFRVQNPEWIARRRLLLVDDVVTTGATLEAALGALADAGACVSAVALAWAQ